MNTLFVQNLPRHPGCYIMKNKDGEVIYVGKAKDLKKRVSSYFQNKRHDPKTMELVRAIFDIDYIITGNEQEALLLEARLIRQFQPRYNMILKDSRRYMYIKITDEELPRLESVHRIDGRGKYFGPFVYGKARKYLLISLARLFGLRADKFVSKSGKELYGLLAEIHSVKSGQISKKDYLENVKMAELLLKGKKDLLLKRLRFKMATASARQNYELAKSYRDKIEAVISFSDRQVVSLPKNFDQDAINYSLVGDKAFVNVFGIKKGVISSKNEFELDAPLIADRDFILENFLRQYYLTRPVPKEIIIPRTLNGEEEIKNYLSDKASFKVRLVVPKQGDKKKILDLLKRNIVVKLKGIAEFELQAALNLSIRPDKIDCFDVSNLGGTLFVGSCVRLEKGGPNKNLYRRFKIKHADNQNDFAMIKEIVYRRYREKKNLPDLVVVDGGKGQLSFASRALKELNLSVPLISLAKREEEIFVLGKSLPIVLDKNSSALKLLRKARDEAHRFAISYNRLLRIKR